MNTITALGLIVIAVIATALISYSVFGNDHWGSQSKSNQTPTAQPTEIPVLTEVPTETPTPTPTPEPTPMPSVYITAPAVPEFTVQLVNCSYDVEPVYRTDPYTNETYLFKNGYHVENYTIDVTIKNQPFTSINLPDGNTTELCYDISGKGYYEGWDQATHGVSFYATSNSAYTVYSFVVNNYEGWWISPNGLVDIRVKAEIGYHYMYWISSLPMFGQRCFESLSESLWSDAKTITGPP